MTVKAEGGGLAESPTIDWLAGIADPVKFAVVRVLADAGSATISDLAEGCEASVPTLRRHLGALIAIGIVTEESGASDGLTVGRPAIRYRLPYPILVSARQLLPSRSTVHKNR
jgi:DNA-binding transcriptional ArsR family regulator